ncbi:hypothetical protein O3P69_012367 [Scylla paramamosain]|uniref:Uncharacterized protein n=1 Tax=Scylla paramamosain TaxID=85552 RepID=A0AAW0SIQ9_SCYPA
MWLWPAPASHPSLVAAHPTPGTSETPSMLILHWKVEQVEAAGNDRRLTAEMGNRQNSSQEEEENGDDPSSDDEFSQQSLGVSNQRKLRGKLLPDQEEEPIEWIHRTQVFYVKKSPKYMDKTYKFRVLHKKTQDMLVGPNVQKAWFTSIAYHGDLTVREQWILDSFSSLKDLVTPPHHHHTKELSTSASSQTKSEVLAQHLEASIPLTRQVAKRLSRKDERIPADLRLQKFLDTGKHGMQGNT